LGGGAKSAAPRAAAKRVLLRVRHPTCDTFPQSPCPAFPEAAVMASRIEDYALIGDCHTAGLVARDGSLDWLCVPRFDSGACFAALLGTPDNGRWLVAPAGEVRSVRRAYRDGTLVLDTEFSTYHGTVTVTDCMLPFG